jgi:LPPG:FO 2-phospho-L-lactate transferase
VILALAGGVGGARLANGLARVLPPGTLMVAVNVGDDFEHLGLHISPDIDSVTYTLAGRNNRETGWGLAGESWAFMDELKALGGEDWFALGDRDLAKHVLRSQRLRAGETLSAITADLARRQGIAQAIVPVSDDPLRSIVVTDEGRLAFQDYFVRRRCEPRFLGIEYRGAEVARLLPAVAAALANPDLEAIVLCPSNPLLSIGPMLAIPALGDALRRRRIPCVAVSPFIDGEAVKGPAAKIMRELGLAPGAGCLLDMYRDCLDAILCDADDPLARTVTRGVILHGGDTWMRDDANQARVAGEVLALARGLARRG